MSKDPDLKRKKQEKTNEQKPTRKQNTIQSSWKRERKMNGC